MVAVQIAIGAVIRRERQLRRWRLRDVAVHTGLSVVYLGEIERGGKYPSAFVLEKIAAAFTMPMPELFVRVADELRGTLAASKPDVQWSIAAQSNGDTTAPDMLDALMERLGPDERRSVTDFGAFLLARRNAVREGQ